MERIHGCTYFTYTTCLNDNFLCGKIIYGCAIPNNNNYYRIVLFYISDITIIINNIVILCIFSHINI